jgi:DNA-binding transcriptional LysR family regulator
VAVVIPPPTEVRHTLIGVQAIRAVLPAHHRLASRRRLRLEDLRGETFIANPTSYNLRQLTETWCQTAGYSPHIALEITEFVTMRELIGRGLGIALLPHDDRSAADIAEVPLTPDTYRRDISLAWGPTAVTPASRRLVAFIRDRFA